MTRRWQGLLPAGRWAQTTWSLAKGRLIPPHVGVGGFWLGGPQWGLLQTQGPGALSSRA